MNKEMYKLKNLLYDLEYYIQNNRVESILKSTADIKDICDKIESIVKIEKIEIDCDSCSKSIEFDIINVLDFIYLPFDYAMEDDNSYIERFSNRRFDNLKNANALGDHNNFWSQHETVDGNIYGSMPAELLNVRKVELLQKAGWEKVSVEIIDFSKSGYDKTEIKKYCKKNLYRYIILKENETLEILVLNYNLNVDGVYKWY